MHRQSPLKRVVGSKAEAEAEPENGMRVAGLYDVTPESCPYTDAHHI
jgi:hypothetical protein